MQGVVDFTGWTALTLGLAALFAGIGALRQPGIWRTMVDEIIGSPTLQFLSGMMELVIAALVYLSNPWIVTDPLSCFMKAMGGLMLIEALAILGFCDIYSQLWVKSLAAMNRGWAAFTALFGLALTVAGGLHLAGRAL
ncbi:MAG: hypothetical protein M0R03_04085 [Novosphingobium sp.]|nr:hypothetical protein [Novosphingobium sp.]